MMNYLLKYILLSHYHIIKKMTAEKGL